MLLPTSINGALYDWDSVEILLPTGIAIGIQNINYSDERPVKMRYGRGSQPRGYGRGNYGAKGDIELDLDEAQKLTTALAAAGKGEIYNAPPFPIVCAYGNDGMPIITDTLPLCKLVKTSTGAKQGDENVGVRKFDLEIVAPILWGYAPAMLPV
jgi:hypothetical protein